MELRDILCTKVSSEMMKVNTSEKTPANAHYVVPPAQASTQTNILNYRPGERVLEETVFILCCS